MTDKLEPIDGVDWEEIAENTWFCGIYRYRFDCEAIIRKNDAGRFEWAIRLLTDASGETEAEEAGTYASLSRAEKKIQTLFAEFMERPSVQDPKSAEGEAEAKKAAEQGALA